VFPTVTLCPDEPYDYAAVNKSAYSLSDSNDDNLETNIQLLKILTQLSYDNIHQAAELAKKISNDEVTYLFTVRGVENLVV
jgi:hypothetical protein